MKLKQLGAFAVVAVVLSSCYKEPTVTDGAEYLGTEKEQIKATYADMAFAVYTDSYLSAVEMQTAINAFIASPSQSNLDAAKDAWLAAREIYGQTEVFRFVDGPIDNPNDGPEGLINAWPMDESYVDYVDGNSTAGIINNPVEYPVIDAATIIGANEFGGETNISCGYHAIEFLLWGQDLNANGPGDRPFTDYVIGGSADNQLRRAQYLSVCAEVLVDALDQVRDDWDPAVPTSYYHTFLDLSNTTALRKMFNSIKVLAGFELAGERIFVAYENQDQEDEHSCFSDNTHRDIALNAEGIFNLYVGEYDSPYGNDVSGPSLSTLVDMVNPTKNDDLMARLVTTRTLISEMYTPFDQAIVLPAERPKVYAVVQSLEAEAELFVSAAGDFGIFF